MGIPSAEKPQGTDMAMLHPAFGPGED